MSLTEKYIYLDGEEEREQLAQAVKNVRQELLTLVAKTPESIWYEPRYHGWSLAAMVAHLNLIDNLSMTLIRASTVGIRPKISLQLLNSINGLSSRLFRHRLMETSLTSIPSNEERILTLIRKLPMASFSKKVYLPTAQKYITVEQAMQHFYLHHWQEHINTVRTVEDKQTSDTDGGIE